MTLGEGKRRVLMLLDEYSSGGTAIEDEDINAKLADLFDMAQKDMANFKKIVRTRQLIPDGNGESMTSWQLPQDLSGIFRVWQEGRAIKAYTVIGDRLITPKGGSVTLEYFAVPSSLGPDTPDSYVFELSEDAAACLPFFVASQQLMPDLVVDYRAFYNTYITMRASLDLSVPEGGGAGVRQALFRR